MAQFVRNLAEKAPVLVNGECGVSVPEWVNSMTGRPRRPEEDAGCGNPRGLRELGGDGLKVGGPGGRCAAPLASYSPGLQLGFSVHPSSCGLRRPQCRGMCSGSPARPPLRSLGRDTAQLGKQGPRCVTGRKFYLIRSACS